MGACVTSTFQGYPITGRTCATVTTAGGTGYQWGCLSPDLMRLSRPAAVAAAMFLLSFGTLLFELALTRLFAVVLFASSAHLALAIALLGISVGAVVQHLWPSLLPERGLERRLAWLGIAQAVSVLVAVGAAVRFPLTEQFAQPPESFGERSSIAWDLIDPVWFTALVPLLIVPFAITGLAFAGAFHRRRERITELYAADLLGGAAGAVAFVPLLGRLAAPDVAFVVALAGVSAAILLFWSELERGKATATGLFGLGFVALLQASLAGHDLHRVQYAAGYSEDNVTYSRWTPLARLAVHEDDRGAFVLLDNTSASQVVRTVDERRAVARGAARGLVYRLHEPPARIAVLAASAGPEVAAAQHVGHTDILAIDLSAEIGDIVSEQFPVSPANPFRQRGVRRVRSDGRAAILHSSRPFDIIQMVNANLHSAGGLLASAWSPALLETKEAFHTYLDKLTDNGTISFAASTNTNWHARAAYEALRERGVKLPGDHMAYIVGDQTLLLVKKRPFGQLERLELLELLERWPGSQRLLVDPLNRDLGLRRSVYQTGPVMTDNRPYYESSDGFIASLGRVAPQLVGLGGEAESQPVDIVYKNLVLQVVVVAFGGAFLVFVPLVGRGAVGLRAIGPSDLAVGLAYVGALGYGYLALETVLIHQLVLYVGHPVYAVTVVIATVLLASGVGSLLAGRIPVERRLEALRWALVAILGLAALQVWLVPAILQIFAVGLEPELRALLVGVALFPLGLCMGLPFPLGIHLLGPRMAGLVPWAWALNGWTSVVASLGTVFLSRLFGYDQATVLALAAYGLALALAGRLPGLGGRLER
ncbi:MAG: hypothetical protein ACI8PZ_003026 [Myxococcota bacterium]|jgi:hypothetical protein